MPGGRRTFGCRASCGMSEPVEPTDITVHVLREIRDELREVKSAVQDAGGRIDSTNARLDQTNARLDETNVGLDRTREELSRRIVESEMRTSSALVDVAGSIREVKDLLSDRLEIRDRVERCEREIDWLKSRVGGPG
jgi:chromosome segregation ATPase